MHIKRISRALAAAALTGVMALSGAAVANAAPAAETAPAAGQRRSPDGKLNTMGKPLSAANNTMVGRAAAALPKGKPPTPGAKGKQTRTVSVNGKLLALTYFYAGGYQYPGGSPLPDGGYSRFRITNPFLQVSGNYDFHSLTEVAVQSADGQQIVEVGYIKNDNLCGAGASPCLFVGYWVNNAFGGYGTNFTPVAGSPITVGETLPVASDLRRFMIQFYDGVWWVGYEKTLGTPEWFGYYDHALWGGASPSVTFQKMGLGQVFGELAANSSTPCSDIGNGNFGDNGATPPVTNTSAAYTNSWTLLNPATGITSSLLPDEPTPAYYRVGFQTSSTRSFYYGGPGSGGVVGGC